MMLRSRAAQTTIFAIGSALAFMATAVGDHAHTEGSLDARYTISFARIPVGEITASVVEASPGDTIVVTRLDRLARSTRDLLNLLDGSTRTTSASSRCGRRAE